MSTTGTNRLLDCLAGFDGKMLAGRLEAVELPVGTILYRPGEIPQYAHFMTSGITSVVTFMEDGSGTEVGLIGCEGLVEALHLLGPGRIQTNGFVQVAGTALRMEFLELRKEFDDSGLLRRLILEGVQGQYLILSQIAACQRLHALDARLARWLLMVRDRMGTDRFELTQEFLAEMIGVQRTTVTMAAGVLQRKGLIEYRRGHIHILDGEALEQAACECYPIVRAVRDNLYAGGS